LILLYDQPAMNWNEALPIGNGIQVIFGGIHEEMISLNHTDFWSGAPKDWNNAAAAGVFPEVMDAMRKGKIQGSRGAVPADAGPIHPILSTTGRPETDF
jgi:hypothetical protein